MRLTKTLQYSQSRTCYQTGDREETENLNPVVLLILDKAYCVHGVQQPASGNARASAFCRKGQEF